MTPSGIHAALPRRWLILGVGLSLAVAAACNKSPGAEPAPQTPLEAALLDYMGAQGEPRTAAHPRLHSLVDLDGDGVSDAVVLLRNRTWCGSGGCTLVVFQGVGKGFRFVSRSTLVKAPVRAASGKSQGWRSLLVRLSGEGARARFALLSFDGQGYPLNPSLAPVAKSGDLAGSEVLIRESERSY